MTAIQNFRNIIGGGVHPNQFKAYIKYPGTIGIKTFAEKDDSALLIKAAALPGETIGNIDVFFRGRAIKVPGDKVFTDLTVTIYSDTNFKHRQALEVWMDAISDNQSNLGLTTPAWGSMKVSQLDRKGVEIRAYRYEDIYPTEIAQIDLALDTNDSVQEYTVTFAVNRWELLGLDGLKSSAESIALRATNDVLNAGVQKVTDAVTSFPA